jgi:hypothetical protein
MNTNLRPYIDPIREHKIRAFGQTQSGKPRKPARQQLHCSECGSTDVLVDAYAEWDVILQRFVIGNTFDKGGYCNKCDGETRAEWERYRILPPDYE